ncbi:MAG: hypothetical protein ACRDPG_10995 [Nocardioidaceae bacterium]
MSRILAVTRMHLTDRLTLFTLPPAILASSFLVNMLIFAKEPVDSRTTGGAAAIYCVVFVAAVMCTARGVTFALSMGASRRAFALGTGLVGALLAVTFGIFMLVLNRIEMATGGWWLHGQFFAPLWFAHNDLAAIWLILTLPFLATFLLGAWVSTIWLRWKTVGMLVGGVVAVLVLGGLAVLATWLDAWASVGHWFAHLTPLSASGWVALLCLPLAGASYLVLRRLAL